MPWRGDRRWRSRRNHYDIVCNGLELSSGAIRNHRPDIIYKAFEIAGYPRREVERRFVPGLPLSFLDHNLGRGIHY